MFFFGIILLFRFCFFVFCVKLLFWIKFIVYIFVFDDCVNYNVVNVLIFCFNLLLLISMFLNVIVFGINNVVKVIMLLVLWYCWIELSKFIVIVFDYNFIKLFMYSVCLFLSVWFKYWKFFLIYFLLFYELNFLLDFFGIWNFKIKKNW